VATSHASELRMGSPSVLRSLYVVTVEGVISTGVRSLAAAETVLWAVLFHDELEQTEDS
jgi:hypothetical protein